jgi:glutamine synthetase
MTSTNYKLTPNILVSYLEKDPKYFTKNDLVTFIADHDIKMVNFHYVADDGRLKTLNFVINSMEHLNELLSSGERADGSSLFSHIQAGESDLYVIPRYRTAFVNPFSEVPSLDLLCTFFTKDGKPLDSGPDYILHKANNALKERTGMEFEAMGELEYYIVSDNEELFPAYDQKGYQESAPFNKQEEFRLKAMELISQSGGKIKYGHSEVGNFVLGDKNYEQNEIEFLPCPVEEAADQLIIAKWILRQLAFHYDVNITFAPKITEGKAGSGMHVHTRLIKNGKNAIVEGGSINDVGRKVIAGYLKLAPSLTAFGNTNPTSYFRLVPHQEAPTNICWGDRNRSVLVRVPLGWTGTSDMAQVINPIEEVQKVDFSYKQTIEYRAADGSANVYLLLAGLTTAALYGLEMDDALSYARETYVDINIFDNKEVENSLATLPDSCVASAKALREQKKYFMNHNIFTEDILDDIANTLEAYNDVNLRKEVESDKAKLTELVQSNLHCG